MSAKIGLLLRSYAKESSDAEDVAKRAIKSVKNAYHLFDESGNHIFEQIVVLVPRDYDCGDTALLIREKLLQERLTDRTVVSSPQGHHSCGVLNAGIEILESEGVGYAVIISNKAIAALNHSVMRAIAAAFEEGAKVVGVAVDELQDVVIAGRVQNTFAAWDIQTLIDVGGFDSENGEEEIAPSIQLVRKYGQCIAALVPSEVIVLDIRKSPDGVARHHEVMTTKATRQHSAADRLGTNFMFIQNGIMPGYPKTF